MRVQRLRTDSSSSTWDLRLIICQEKEQEPVIFLKGPSISNMLNCPRSQLSTHSPHLGL